MKRRKLLIAGGLSVAGFLCGGLDQLIHTVDSLTEALPAAVNVLPPTAASPFSPTPFHGVTLVSKSPDPTAILGESATITPTPSALDASETTGYRVMDTFSSVDFPTRVIASDSAQQMTIAEDMLRVTGKAPGDNNPKIFDNHIIQLSRGQAIGTRIKVYFGKESGMVGLVSAAGERIAGVRRTGAEGEGGILACGQAEFPVMNLYSGCWYDFIFFFNNGETAFAVNDGAGLELVLVAENKAASQGYIGYCASQGQNQGMDVDAWYAPGPRCILPTLAQMETAPQDYAVDAGTNAAWVEVGIQQNGGKAGLRVRSVDRENEYRVYLEGTDLKVDQVVNGTVSPVIKQAVSYVDGGRLAVRYNELTLTVYYNGALVGVPNHKIGVPKLLVGTQTGVYSTDAGNVFSRFAARPVRLSMPAVLDEQLLHSRRVLCLGDSLTNADKAFGYQNLLRKRLGDGWATVDGGVSGQTTYQMLSRLPSHLRCYQPETVIVLGGTNDIDNHFEPGVIEANLQSIYKTAKQAGARVIAVTIPPAGNANGWTSEKQNTLQSVNDWILNAAQAVDYRADAFTALVQPGTQNLRDAYDGGDHMHLSGAGYSTLAAAVLRSAAW